MVATIRVGARELKRRVSGLVREAAAGGRVIVTKYGRPYAVLGPADAGDSEASVTSGRMAEWLEERRAFERLRPGLRRRGLRGWVAVHRGRVVASGKDAEALYQRVWKRLDGGTFFLGRLDGSPPVVDVPGFELT
jgi:prevent-host-death family protein